MQKQKNIKRVLLCYPNQRWLKFDLTTTWDLSPYGICMLATTIQDRYEVKIVDAQFNNLSEEQFADQIRTFAPDLVGISLLTSEYAPILATAASIIKSVNPTTLTLAGGVHVTTQYEQVMTDTNIDYAVRGEGERVLGQFLDWLNDEAIFPTKGLVYRDANNPKHLVTLPPDLIDDLDQLPLPNYDLVDYPAYTMHKPRYGVDSLNVFPHARILTSRGCPVGCSFCQVESISGKKWRMRSAENVVDEIVYLHNRYGIKGFIVEDDNAFVQKKRTKEMLRLLKQKKLGLSWKAAGVPIFNMDEETFKLMAETGCQLVGLPIESGVPRILKQIIKKPVDLEKAPELIRLAQRYGIFVAANFIIGFPTETWDEIRQTLRYAETCGADYCKIYAAQPLLGTELYELAKQMGCLVGDEHDVGWRHGRICTSEFTPKDISILRAYEWDRINFTDATKREKTADIMGISLEELGRIRKQTRESLTF
ncbi:B12-binding domain-containing radical SAM protein [Trichlorobacter lovleyi]|uniref:B12-binding domain-containing radical SAM protein n=1 Tax=Trichlorobacter lovleyi TaxID=313985 RepID=UPI003D0ABBFF